MWPLTQNIMEANIGNLPTKFGYKQAYGWKVSNRNRVLQVNFHIWPHLTFDLLTWSLTPEYCGGQHRPSPTKFGYKQAYGWKVINAFWVLQVNFHIWPLTYLHDLWSQNIVEANIGHLPTKFGYKQAYGWKVINPKSLTGKLSHLTSFDLWPTYVTFDHRISWRPILGIYQPSLVTNRHMVGKLSTIIESCR